MQTIKNARGSLSPVWVSVYLASVVAGAFVILDEGFPRSALGLLLATVAWVASIPVFVLSLMKKLEPRVLLSVTSLAMVTNVLVQAVLLNSFRLSRSEVRGMVFLGLILLVLLTVTRIGSDLPGAFEGALARLSLVFAPAALLTLIVASSIYGGGGYTFEELVSNSGMFGLVLSILAGASGRSLRHRLYAVTGLLCNLGMLGYRGMIRY